jgi:hypothetical protein
LPAWLFSVFLHLIAVTTAVVLLSPPTKGTGARSQRQVGLAIAHELPDRTQYEPVSVAGEQGATGDPQTQAAQNVAAALPSLDQSPIDLQSLLGEAVAPVAGAAGQSVAAALTPATGVRGGGGTGLTGLPATVTTSMFGIEGTGRRFVYAFDRSESMTGYGGRPLQVAKQELLKSIRGLKPEHEFQVVFYNQRAIALPPGPGQPPRMLHGDSFDLAIAEKYTASEAGSGGTKHLEAVRMALRMEPDVIFLLTDARVPRLSSAQLDEIRARALRRQTTIHCIELGSDPSPPQDSFLRDLAEQNRGQYIYFDVTKFSGDGRSSFNEYPR